MGGGAGAARRIDWVDIAKGICIIFVVMMHSTLGVEKAAGAQGWMHYVVAFAKPFRMPDFFLISGLFLSLVIDRPWRRYLDRKVVHFLYFYILWLTIQFAFKAPGIASEAGISGVVNAYLMAFIEPFGTLWFIYILPVFFIATRLLKRVPVGITFAALAFLEILPIHTGWVMVDEFCSRFVYFFAGYAFAPAIFRIADWLRQRPLIGIAGLLVWSVVEVKLVFMPVPESLAFLIPPAADLLDGRGAVSDLPIMSLLLGIVGALAIISVSSLLGLLAEKNWLHRGLSWLGAHSIVVYLAFFLPMAIARTVLLKLGIGDIGTVSLLTTASGVIGPVILYGLIQWTGYGQFLFRRPAWAYIDAMPQKKTAATAAV
ncbi:acyltransferase family protein [Falsochrobactrum sp. TDYN1]|uniref:Acyltransferase family protein n=1 Tax=Falsochrobactrum tianjinense TaxID=2706015 RepID=A0A949UTE0_9HYPH|nr:acyltransferase family protein [Falsochrobactrum sp. TDYN1]MBV2142276.1 acyltransferase family protein [Falsochrobactrum sp. TDYN1]